MTAITGVDYSKSEAPPEYICANCGAGGVKLWREYQTFDPKLLCAKCAAEDQGKSIKYIDEKGLRPQEPPFRGRTDQIGWYVPAVPDEEGVGYWGYSSVPDAGVKWWRNLPTLNG